MPRLLLLFVLLLACPHWLFPGCLVRARAQSVASALVDEVRINGLVIDRKKYSFTVQSLDRQYEVSLPNGIPLMMKLNHPTIDLQDRKLSLTLMLSAPDGVAANDQILSWSLPEPVYVYSEFADEQEKQEVLNQPVRTLDRFLLSPTPLQRTPLTIGGELAAGRSPGQWFLDDNGAVYSIKLGTRRGLLTGFTIMDLKPLQTSVWVQGAMEGDRVVASRVRFECLGDPTPRFDPTLPNLLSLGDVTSYEYQRPLIEALAGKVNVHHPPTWTGPSQTWDRLHHYIGRLDAGQETTWDVIAFNYGMRDESESRENYQQNLRNAIRLLRRTGARLVWVTSTPIPRGYPSGDPQQPLRGRVPGRMDLQNQWAAAVVSEFPEVHTCDLWQVVDDGKNGPFAKWWERREIHFDPQQSIPLGRELAKVTLEALGSTETINPLSVHQLTDSLSRSQ